MRQAKQGTVRKDTPYDKLTIPQMHDIVVDNSKYVWCIRSKASSV
jgi:hypothetical protein